MWLWQRGLWLQRSPARLKTALAGGIPRLAEKADRRLVPHHTLEILPPLFGAGGVQVPVVQPAESCPH